MVEKDNENIDYNQHFFSSKIDKFDIGMLCNPDYEKQQT